MSKQIKRTDIVEKDIFKNLIDSADASISKLKLMNDQFVVMAKTIKSSMKTAKFDTTKELNEFIKATKSATTVSKEQVKVMQELEKANALKAKAQQELIRVEKEQLKLQDQAIKTARTKLTDDEKQEKINARKQKSIDDESNAYKRLEKNTRDLKNSSKQLGAELLELERAGKKNTKEYTNLERKFNDVTRQAQKGDQALKKLDKTVGDNFRNVGNYRDALGSLQGILSSVGIAFGLGTIVQGATKSIIGFEQANATLSAVLGKTSAETQDLQKIQRELGRTSGFTATQVGELQIELARLGFTENEIKGATESVLLLAKATGSDLGRASEVAGATLRGFGLNANEIGRVVDVMAKSFDMSALGMENFAESMKYVAPVASSAGVSIEQTTAMLGALSNAGIQGSQAGTSLRRILTDMAMTGKPAKEALEELASKGINLTDAMDEVGRSAQTSLLVLTKNMDSVNGMTTAFENADGAVVKTATTMGDTLQGSINRLRGAWEAWLLDLNQGTGASNSFRDAIDFLTKNLATILNLVVDLSEIWIKYKIITLGQIAINKLMASSFVQTIRSAESLGGVMKGIGGLIQKVGTAIKNNLAGIALFVIGNIIMKYKELNDIYATTKSNAEELANAQNDIATNLKKETIEAGALFEALKKTNNGSVERSALITEINGKYGTTLENLKDEKKFVDQVNTSYNDLIKTMTAKAEMEGIRIKFEMSQGQLAKAEMDYSQAVDNYNEYINNATAGSKVLDELLTNFGVTSEKDLEDIKDAYFTVFASATKQADIYKDDFIKAQAKIVSS
ncbi:MAG: phage tail tape measure protein, partial [Bacteroidota bacterium]